MAKRSKNGKRTAKTTPAPRWVWSNRHRCHVPACWVEGTPEYAQRQLSKVADTLDRATKRVTTQPAGADSADTKADNGEKLPENLDVVRLAKFIRKNRKPGESEASLARQFTEGNATKAASLLRSLRRHSHLRK